jgi:adenylyltransferase/sulfurtransferase
LTENRYSRQILLPEIGAGGQKKLAKGRAVVIGCGALGTHVLSFLVRAGVGEVTFVDRDIVDLSNLQRQTLFSEPDVGRPKAKVAEAYLKKINSDVKVRGIVADVNHTNIERLVEGADVVLDATDNMDTRFLVNDACVKNGIPWVYAGAVGTTGMILPVVPGGPCLRCVFPSPPQPGELPTCDTVGIVNTLPAAVASVETTEGFRVMLGKAVSKELTVIDIWSGEFQKIKVKKNPDCTCCGKRDFEFLNAKKRKYVVSMCGRNAVQIVPSKPRKGDLADLKKKLSRSGKVTLTEGILKFKAKDADLTVFPDGRTIVGGTTDLSVAKTLFSRYVGD